MPLQKLLERECDLHYYMHLSQQDLENMDITEIKFKDGWLQDKKKAERVSLEKIIGNR